MTVRHLGLWIALLAVATGCGESGPPLVDVEGTVSFDGEPLSKRRHHLPARPGQRARHPPGWPTPRRTAPIGPATKDDTAWAEGSYKVTLNKIELAEGIEGVPEEMLNDPAQMEMGGMTQQTLPDTYADVNTSKFDIAVASGGGPYDFKLDSEGR